MRLLTFASKVELLSVLFLEVHLLELKGAVGLPLAQAGVAHFPGSVAEEHCQELEVGHFWGELGSHQTTQYGLSVVQNDEVVYQPTQRHYHLPLLLQSCYRPRPCVSHPPTVKEKQEYEHVAEVVQTVEVGVVQGVIFDALPLPRDQQEVAWILELVAWVGVAYFYQYSFENHVSEELAELAHLAIVHETPLD